jgi:hypothetical protein
LPSIFHVLSLDWLLWLQESGLTLITAEDLDDAAEKAVKAYAK